MRPSWRGGVLVLLGLLGACTPFRPAPHHPLERLLLDEHYEDVLAATTPARLREINQYGPMVAYDIAQVMVHGRAAPPLLCAEVLKDYPHTIATTMEACRQLQKKLAGIAVTDAELLAMDEVARRHFPRLRYLVTAMTRVRAAPLQ